MACLVYYGKEIPIDKVLTIGRNEINNLHIEEKTISKKHAVIKEIDNKYFIIDLDSTNGTYINHKKISSPIELNSQDIIQVGNVQIIFNNKEENEDDDKTLLAMDDYIVNSIVLVSDIKGYTKFSESVPILIVQKFMNSWFKLLSKIIKNHDGMIDKVIGDCFYARWDKNMNKKDMTKAIKSIYDINEITKQLNTKYLKEYNFNLKIGAAIHCGEVILGDAIYIPSGISDTVNTTFRLESLTREFNADLIMSNEAFDILKLPIENKSEETFLKGKKDLMKIHIINFDDLGDITISDTELV